VLTKYVQYAHGSRDKTTVVLVRDPARHGLHVIITPDTGTATHLWYDEASGQYSPGGGGFFPERYSKSITAGTIWKGKAVFGTSDGYIFEAVDTAASDDVSTAIDAYLTLSLCDEPELENDTVIDSLTAVIGSASGNATLKVYGGKTPEAAYDTAERWLLGTFTVKPVPQKTLIRQRGPALAILINNNTAGQTFTFESLEVSMYGAKPIHRGGWKAALAVGAPCAVPASSSSAASTGASAVSGPGAGSLPTGGSAGSGIVSGVIGGSTTPENGGGLTFS
jgi:hypothetical protein